MQNSCKSKSMILNYHCYLRQASECGTQNINSLLQCQHDAKWNSNEHLQ